MNPGRTRKTPSTDAVPTSHPDVTPPAQSDQALRASVDALTKKVDDLITWKNRVEGGAAVLVAIIAVSWTAYLKFSDWITVKAPSAPAVAAPAPAAPPASAPRE